VTIAAVPILTAQGTITHALAAVGLGSRLGREASLALVRDMQRAAATVASQMI
jgi:DNA-binding IclR family transcriptional regulator